MGMDLYATKPTIAEYESFHVNWSTWRYLEHIFEQLGPVEALKNWSHTNDGVEVSAQDAYTLGRALLTAIANNEIQELRVPDDTYVGGFFYVPFITGKEKPYVYFKDEYYYTITGQEKELLRLELRPEEQKYLVSFALFLMNCGGFKQF